MKNSWGTSWGTAGFGNVLTKQDLISGSANPYLTVTPTFADGGYLAIQKGPLFYAKFGDMSSTASITLDATITSACPISLWLPATTVAPLIEFGTAGNIALGFTE